jgi:CheY-like chemotaxis protein
MGDSRTCILVVDDAPEFLDFLDALLTAEGYRVVAAATWEAASAALASLRPHLVIADVRLGGQPAFAVLDELRADQKTRDIPVLLCTGAVSEVGERAEALRREGVEVLLKPFDLDVLLRTVVRFTGGPAAEGPAPGAP